MTRPLDAAARAHLLRRFAAIPDRMKRVAEREVQAEAEAMAEEMKRGAPHDEGNLQNSIRTEDVSTDTWIRWLVRAGGALTTKPVRNSDKAPMYDYAWAIELGTSTNPAQPFFFPVYRRRKRRFRARLMRELRKAATEK